MTQTSDMQAVTAAIRANERFLVASHENPDGDALGSLLAMHLALGQLGKDSVMFVPGPAPLPGEYAFLPLDGVHREPPADHTQRVLLAVDCAKEERLGPDPSLLEHLPDGIAERRTGHGHRLRFWREEMNADCVSATVPPKEVREKHGGLMRRSRALVGQGAHHDCNSSRLHVIECRP